MGNISYTAHVSNKKSAITSKSKLAAVAKHNLRKYKSSDYSKDNICIIYGTSNLIDDVKTVYHKEFDEALEEYNKKQTRQDRKIEDYFEHVAGKEQDMAVEIIIQIGDREFWRQFDDKESVQWEITAGNRTGTVEQMDANVEAMVRDLQEILRIGEEQKRLWEVYVGR